MSRTPPDAAGGGAPRPDPRSAYPALSVPDRLLLLALALAVFFGLEGRAWAHAFQWDAGILWSYAAVPVLVLLGLWARRRAALLPWLLHSLELGAVKFGITAAFLMFVLVLATPGPPPAPVSLPPVPAARPLPTSPAPPAERGRIAGRLVRGGAPAPAGTVVFISSGLADYAWPVPKEPVALVNGGHGVEPRLAVVELGQRVTAASADRRLHTLVLATAGSAWRLNVPLLADGLPTPLSLAGATGVAEEHCALHGAAEEKAWLVILPHPFHRRLDGDGRFFLDGVPPGHYTLTALLPDGTTWQAGAAVRAGQLSQVEGTLPPPDIRRPTP